MVPTTKIIVFVAVIYSLIVLGTSLHLYDDSEYTLLDVVNASVSLIGVTSAVLWFLFSTFWRAIWFVFPVLNKLVFPNIHGDWKVQISWNDGTANGVVSATAKVNQSFLNFGIEVFSEKSDSETIAVHPKRDSETGRITFNYIYLVRPCNKEGNIQRPYYGTAFLKYTDGNSVEGNYFTDKNTNGHFSMFR